MAILFISFIFAIVSQQQSFDTSTWAHQETTEPKAAAATTRITSNSTRVNNKPKLILHVGLPKTATSFCQCTFCSTQAAKDLFQRHDEKNVFIGTCPYRVCGLDKPPEEYLMHRFGNIFAGPSQLPDKAFGTSPVVHNTTAYKLALEVTGWDKINLADGFVQRLEDAYQKGQNAMLIYEGFMGSSQHAIEALHREMNDRFDVTVLVMYRPLYQWLPSRFNSKHRNSMPKEYADSPMKSNNYYPLSFDLDGRGKFSDSVHYIENTTQRHPAETVRNNFQMVFDDVQVIPMHALTSPTDMDPLLRFLVCSVSDELCNDVDKDGTVAERIKEQMVDRALNPSMDMTYDILAFGAYNSGLIPANGKYPRNIMRQRIERFWKNDLQRTSEDFHHKVCLPSSTLRRLEDLSWAVEQRLFGDKYKEMHRDGFQKAVQQGRAYCSVDVERTLQLPEFKEFFKSLQEG